MAFSPDFLTLYGNSAYTVELGQKTPNGPSIRRIHGSVDVCTTNKEGDKKLCGPCALKSVCVYFNTETPQKTPTIT